MRDYNDKTKWIKVPISEITKPKAGCFVYGGSWWSVIDDCVLFFKSYASPQCNVNREVLKRMKPELEQVYLEFAFIPHNCSDYC